MSYDLMVFEKEKAPSKQKIFLTGMRKKQNGPKITGTITLPWHHPHYKNGIVK